MADVKSVEKDHHVAQLGLVDIFKKKVMKKYGKPPAQHGDVRKVTDFDKLNSIRNVLFKIVGSKGVVGDTVGKDFEFDC